MAFRRSMISRTKSLYQEQRFSPSFSLINSRHDDEHDSSKKPTSNSTSSTRKIPAFLQSPIPTSRCNSCIGFQKGSLSSGLFVNSMSYGSFISGRSMSSGFDGGASADKAEFLGDAADVLSDGVIEDVVIQAAPVVNEVAIAAADSYFPVAVCQHLIDYVHTLTGFNWWTSIVPKLAELKEEMQNRGRSPTAVAEDRKKIKKLYNESGVSPFTPLNGLLLQSSIFISFFLAISNMVKKVPSFKEGGAFWFTDLMTPDSTYILPVLTALTLWMTVECNMQDRAKTMKNVSRGFAISSVFLTSAFAKGIFIYWITANLLSVIFGSVFKNHAVRKALGIITVPITSKRKPTFGFFEGFKKYAATQAEKQRQQALSSTTGGSKPSSQQQPPVKTILQTSSQQQQKSSSSVISQKLGSLDKNVKGRKKGSKKR